MITRNQDIVPMGPDVACYWTFTASMETPTVEDAVDRSAALLDQLLDLCEGFVCPTKVRTAVYCAEPATHLDPQVRRDHDYEYITVEAKECVTFDAWQTAMAAFQCEGDDVPLDVGTYFDNCKVKMYIDGADRWLDRDSEYLVKWKRYEDERRPASELHIESSLWEDPLDINTWQGFSRRTDEYQHRIRIYTGSYIWRAETEAGRINRDRLLTLLEGLASLDCITDGRMTSGDARLYEIVDHIDYFTNPI